MGFLSNTFNSVQFRVASNGVKLTPETIADSLKPHLFKSIDETADEKSVGWVNLFDPTVLNFDNPGLFHIGNYLAFSLRVDQRKVPAAVLRDRCKAAEEAWLAENVLNGYTRVPKQKREELKDAQRAKLLSQLPPVPTVYDIVWNLETDIITFCNLSQRAIELFQDMFKKSFGEGYRLRYVTPYERATNCVTVGLPDDYTLTYGSLLASLEQVNKATTANTLDLLKSNEWIGADFLLWLLHHEEDGGYVRPEVTAYINDKLLLAGASDHGPQKIAFTGDQTKLAAAKAALANGGQIIAARIFMEAEDNTWAFTLRGANFEFAAFKCPPVRLEKDDTTDETMERQAVFLERVALVDKGRELFEGMLRTFLMDRLTIEWSARQADITTWLGGGA